MTIRNSNSDSRTCNWWTKPFLKVRSAIYFLISFQFISAPSIDLDTRIRQVIKQSPSFTSTNFLYQFKFSFVFWKSIASIRSHSNRPKTPTLLTRGSGCLDQVDLKRYVKVSLDQFLKYLWSTNKHPKKDTYSSVARISQEYWKVLPMKICVHTYVFLCWGSSACKTRPLIPINNSPH